MNARDRVKLCIEQARSHSGETALGSVINAVEILAGELKAVPESAQTFIGALDMLSTTPQPNFVERLKKAYVFAEMEAIAGGGDPVDMGVRAILASLSKTPVAMMTADHIATLCGGEDYSPTDRRYARSAVQAFQEFVAPILAANDARIQELESLHAESPAQTFDQLGGFGFDRGPEPVAEMAVHVPSTVPPRFVPENYYAMTESEIMPPVDSDESLPVAHTAEFAPQDGDANTGKWILRADVLNAIDAQVSAANVVAGERLETIELQRKRTVDLEAQIAGLERDRRHCVDAITESNLVPPGRTLLEGIGEFVRLHDHAKTRIAALETRVAVVTRQRDDEHGLSNLRSYEIGTWKKELADARARIAELEASGAATAEGLQAALNMAKQDYMATQTALDNVKDKLQRTEQDLGAKNDRVAELEKQLATGANDIELPTNRECIDAYEYHYKLSSASSMNRPGGESYFDLQRAGMCGVLGLVREKLGSAMAVNKLELLETQQRIAELEKELATTRADIEAHITQARCAVVNLGHPDKTLEDAVRAVEQQKILDGIAAKEAEREQRADVEPDWVVERVRSAIKSSYEDLELLKGPSLAVSCRDMAERAIAELRRIDKEREPLTVDGKTPGEVLILAQHGLRPFQVSREIVESAEHAAGAVLRAFGNSPSGQTAPTNAAEVLRDLKSKLPVAGMYLYAESVQTAWLCALIDDQIALLEGAKSAPTNEFPTFVASKDVIRGSYFCTEFPFRPFLHIGHDVEFDDMPRLLKLGRNDVIEIRVVQRAKQ